MGGSEPSRSQGPLINHVLGCLLWWPLAALVSLVALPNDGGAGIVATGAVLLALRLAHLTWRAARSTAVAPDAATARLRPAAD